jgi:small subunit ribosomal protein S5
LNYSDKTDSNFIEKVINIKRVSKVVKGGRNFSFNALVVVGDGNGRVGYGLGKAREVVDAITKGTDIAKRSLKRYPMVNGTIPHKVIGKYGAGKVIIIPASPGTGIIAGGAVRPILEAVGLRDVLCKSLGSPTHINVLKATIAAMGSMYDANTMSKKRGISVSKLLHLPRKGDQ